jgi:hypothetical protein
MKHLATAALVMLVATLALYQYQPVPAEESTSEQLTVQPFDYINVRAECTKTLELECAIDIEKTVRACATAFETGGADVIADIKCAKDILSDKKHCWPCICAEAKKQGWHIIGC